MNKKVLKYQSVLHKNGVVVSYSQALGIYNDFCDILKNNLLETGSLKITGVGSLNVIFRKSRKLKIPRKNELGELDRVSVTIPPRRALRLRPSPVILKLLNE